jgi:hypothetical protein
MLLHVGTCIPAFDNVIGVELRCNAAARLDSGMCGLMLVVSDPHWSIVNQLDAWFVFPSNHYTHKRGWLSKSHDFALPSASTVNLYLNWHFHVLCLSQNQDSNVTLRHRTTDTQVSISVAYKVSC